MNHAWVATERSDADESPAETHALVMDPQVDEMATTFQVNGAMIHCDR